MKRLFAAMISLALCHQSAAPAFAAAARALPKVSAAPMGIPSAAGLARQTNLAIPILALPHSSLQAPSLTNIKSQSAVFSVIPAGQAVSQSADSATLSPVISVSLKPSASAHSAKSHPATGSGFSGHAFPKKHSGEAQSSNAAHASSFSKKLAERSLAVSRAGKASASPSAQSMGWSSVFDQSGNRIDASPVLAAGRPNGLRHIPMPIPYRDEYTGGKKPGPEEATDLTEYHPELPPVLKIIAELRRLEKNDLPAAIAYAKTLLADKIETRPQVRLASVRVAMNEAGSARLRYLGGLAVIDVDWFIRREAALALLDDIGDDKSFRSQTAEGDKQAADNLAGLLKDALLDASMDEVASVRLAARAALAKLAVEAPAEPLSDEEAAAEKKKKIAKIEKENDPFGYGYVPPPKGLQPGWQKRLAIAVAGLSLLVGLYWYSATHHIPTPPRTPPAASQPVDKTHSSPSISAAPESVSNLSGQATPQAPQLKASPANNTAAQPVPVENPPSLKLEAPAKESTTERAFWTFGPTFLFIGLMIGFFLWMAKRNGSGRPPGLNGKKIESQKERPTTRFKDVAGIDDAVIELQEIVDFLRSPAKYQRLGAKIPKGVLMEGPPGTGKTLSAKAVAGEAEANFFSISGSDFIELFVGVGASRVRELFEQAAAGAPSIIFIDEIDAVGKARGSGAAQGSHDEREQTINALLAAMDGFDNSKGIIVIAATNRADTLDPALRRPGRFDRTVHVGRPDLLGREAILTIHAKGARMGPDADLHEVARRTAGLTGAYMANIVNEAALLAARGGRDAISKADFAKAVDRAIVGQARDLYLPEALKRKIAYHEAGHVLAMMKSKAPSLPNKVTILPHGSGALGYAEWGSEEDIPLYTRDELIARMVGGLGGLAAEKKIYGQGSTGPGNDLDKANEIARMMVTKLGMSEKLGLLVDLHDKENPFGGRLFSEATAREIDLEVKAILNEAMKEAANLLVKHTASHEALVEALMKDETLFREDIERIVATADAKAGIDAGTWPKAQSERLKDEPSVASLNPLKF